jgi:HSP20 family protein
MTTTQVERGSEPTRTGCTYRPNVDILERENELLLLVDLPGARPDGIDVRFENGTLTLHARVEPRQPENRPWLLREYGVGDFHRSFEVNEQVDGSRISAEFADGVLTLHLPRTPASQPRRIEVKAG